MRMKSLWSICNGLKIHRQNECKVLNFFVCGHVSEIWFRTLVGAPSARRIKRK
jgi:hypothetical protein